MADSPGANDVSMFEIVKSRVQSKPDVPLHKMRDRDQPGKPYTSHICLGRGQKQRDAHISSINNNNNNNNTSKIFMTCAQCEAGQYCCRDCQ
eukprot:scaffold193496_cov41-Attheya_sp.AAC.1